MSDEQAVVMRGTITNGWTIYGPFPSFDAASEWADAHRGDDPDWIATLTSPEVTK